MSQTASRSVQPFFTVHDRDIQTDRRTDHASPWVKIARSTAMYSVHITTMTTNEMLGVINNLRSHPVQRQSYEATTTIKKRLKRQSSVSCEVMGKVLLYRGRPRQPSNAT